MCCPSGQIAHGGGRRLTKDSLHYQRLHRWIIEGATNRPGAEITSIEVEPREQIMTFDGIQQLRVTAIDSTGKRRCVTLEAQYDSNAGAIASVKFIAASTPAPEPGAPVSPRAISGTKGSASILQEIFLND